MGGCGGGVVAEAAVGGGRGGGDGRGVQRGREGVGQRQGWVEETAHTRITADFRRISQRACSKVTA